MTLAPHFLSRFCRAWVRQPDDLLLDTIDPRSRLGEPLDFRDFLPQIAWLGLSPDPGKLILFLFFCAGSVHEKLTVEVARLQPCDKQGRGDHARKRTQHGTHPG